MEGRHLIVLSRYLCCIVFRSARLSPPQTLNYTVHSLGYSADISSAQLQITRRCPQVVVYHAILIVAHHTGAIRTCSYFDNISA